MTIADRRERDKQQRRDSIVDAAERLFFTKGFPVTTIDEIAEAAELSKGTIYLYFKNKEEIYVAIVQRGLHFLTELFREAIAKSPTGRDKVRAIGQALLTFYERHPHHFKALFYQHDGPSCPLPDIDRGGPLIKALIHDGEELYAFCVEAIRSGIADGSIPPDVDPLKATVVFVSMILGLVRMVAVEEKFLLKRFNLSGEDLIKAAFEMLDRPLADPRQQKGPKGR
jgi:TetR/AcrR family transcriptional regulator